MKNMKNGSGILVLLFSVSLLFVTTTFAAEELDTTFGVAQTGIVLNEFKVGDDEAYDFVVQDDGKIVVVGYTIDALDADNKQVALARYHADGSLDTTFGVDQDGTVVMDIGDWDDVGTSIALQSDGGFLVAGYSNNGSDDDIFLARFHADGSPDSTFNLETINATEGSDTVFEALDDSGEDRAYGVAVQEDGKVVVAGYTTRGDSKQVAILRFNENGTEDSSFGQEGIATLTRDEDFDFETAANNMVLDVDGNIIVAGYRVDGEKEDGAVFRFTEEGELDTSFNDSGMTITVVANVHSVVNGLAIQESDGKIVIAGGTEEGDDQRMYLARLNRDGSFDSSFGEEGIVKHDPGFDSVAYSVAIANDGTIYTTGYGVSNSQNSILERHTDILLAHYDSIGELVELTTEAESGDNSSEVSGISISPLRVEDEAGDSPEAIADSVNLTVETEPLLVDIARADDVGRALAVQPDDTIITVGFAQQDDENAMVVARFSAASEVPTVLGTEYYNIGTIPVSNIGRNSAVSGGKITKKNENDDDVPAISKRGVVYGIVPHPTYNAADDDADDSGTDTADDSGDTATSSSRILPATPSYNYDVVRSGQTDDDSGVGIYGSDIFPITPDVWYYVRAYAVLDDDTVIYGNEFSFLTRDACFIATAAYGSFLDQHVQVLRDFRDVYLLDNSLGQKCVGLYYKWSPPLAGLISESETLRRIARVLLLPLVWLSQYMLYASMFLKIMTIAGLLVVATLLVRNRFEFRRVKS